jgi:hypothetical protein
VSDTSNPSMASSEVSSQVTALTEVFGEEFGKNFRDPVICLETTLSAPPPISMYKRDFRLLSRALYLESVYRRREGFNQEILNSFEKMLGEKLGAIRQLFENRRQQLMKLYNDNGVLPVQVYMNTQSFTVPVIAPYAKSFIDLLDLLDGYYNLTGCAALHGLLKSDQRRTSEMECRKAVRSFIGMVRTEQAKLRKENIRMREERGIAHDPDELIAEKMADEASHDYDKDPQEGGSPAQMSESQAVLDSIVSTGIAATKAASRTAKPAGETKPTVQTETQT